MTTALYLLSLPFLAVMVILPNLGDWDGMKTDAGSLWADIKLVCKELRA